MLVQNTFTYINTNSNYRLKVQLTFINNTNESVQGRNIILTDQFQSKTYTGIQITQETKTTE